MTARDEYGDTSLPPVHHSAATADPAQTRFRATISHALRSPLNVVMQLDGSLDRRFPESDPGLYASPTTAQAHGGDLVRRCNVGMGTTAILRLPANRLIDQPLL